MLCPWLLIDEEENESSVYPVFNVDHCENLSRWFYICSHRRDALLPLATPSYIQHEPPKLRGRYSQVLQAQGESSREAFNLHVDHSIHGRALFFLFISLSILFDTLVFFLF